MCIAPRPRARELTSTAQPESPCASSHTGNSITFLNVKMQADLPLTAGLRLRRWAMWRSAGRVLRSTSSSKAGKLAGFRSEDSVLRMAPKCCSSYNMHQRVQMRDWRCRVKWHLGPGHRNSCQEGVDPQHQNHRNSRKVTQARNLAALCRSPLDRVRAHEMPFNTPLGHNKN